MYVITRVNAHIQTRFSWFVSSTAQKLIQAKLSKAASLVVTDQTLLTILFLPVHRERERECGRPGCIAEAAEACKWEKERDDPTPSPSNSNLKRNSADLARKRKMNERERGDGLETPSYP